MGELNIARQLLKARHEKKITQEELANYIGVSKAAVSKWENGTSFPDITILPQLATYYNMSIDSLMGYEPQMTKAQIKKTYHDLKEAFAQEKWDEVMERCEALEKKYYSCFPLLLQMVILYINHAMLGPDPAALYRHCIELAERIRTEGEDINDAKSAMLLETNCYLLLGEPMNALDLMDEHLRPIDRDMETLGQIYQFLGNVEKADETYQVAMYQHLLYFVGDSTSLLMVCAHDLERAERLIQRTNKVIETYELDQLHPNTTAGYYISSAQVYCINGKVEEAIEMLERYTVLCEHHFFPLTLHGDDFFNKLDGWFEEFDLGNQAPRSDELVRESMLTAVEKNPAFVGLYEDKRFKMMVKRLKNVRNPVVQNSLHHVYIPTNSQV